MNNSNTAEKEVNNTIPLHLHAMDNISFIRETMYRFTQFTTVPGWGMVIVGIIATLGSDIATLHLSSSWWFNTWITIGFISMAISVISMVLKARNNQTLIFSIPGRRFLLCFTPTIVAGMALTDLMYWEGIEHLLACQAPADSSQVLTSGIVEYTAPVKLNIYVPAKFPGRGSVSNTNARDAPLGRT